MRNVLVVDDEFNICEGIRTVLLQADFGIENVFMARNGYEALDYLHMEDIDFMISDIRMDEMDGLELLASVYIEKPSLPVVIISAYEHFTYAQEAMRLGAKDYLVKPLDVAQLLKTVQRWIHSPSSTLQEVVKASLEKTSVLKEMSSQENYMLNEILDTPNLTGEEIQVVWNSLGLPLTGPYYGVMRIRLDLNSGGLHRNAITTLKDKNLFKYAASNIIMETLDKWAHILVPQSGVELTVIFQFNEEEVASFPAQQGIQLGIMGRLIHENMETYLRLKNVIGISSLRNGWHHLYELKSEACKALTWHEMMPDQSIFYIQDFEKYAAGPDTTDSGHEAFGKVNHSILLKILEFLQTSYHHKGLKLQDIANEVHLSTNHISYLFRKFMKMTVWDYVLKLRMEQAKTYLLTTDMKRYEISEAIGYETPEHFSKIFKKYYGVSPSDIRMQTQSPDNPHNASERTSFF